MLTTSQKILRKINEYSAKGYFSFVSMQNDSQVVLLHTDTASAWQEDDEFFTNLVFSRFSLNDPITFVLDGNRIDEVYVKLEGRVIPNLTMYLGHLGYTPDLHASTVRVHNADDELEEIFKADIVDEFQLLAVDVVREPVNEDCRVDIDSLSTSQPKTTKKRKIEK